MCYLCTDYFVCCITFGMQTFRFFLIVFLTHFFKFLTLKQERDLEELKKEGKTSLKTRESLACKVFFAAVISLILIIVGLMSLGFMGFSGIQL